MDKLSKLLSYIYAIILFVGGIFGFTKVHSKISLLTGAVSALLVLVSCKIGNEHPKSAYLYISAISLVLAGFFSYRYSLTHSFMPAGLMVLVSVTTLAVVGLNYLKSAKK